uniref:Uncharacterized protein n=1 Tax=Arundo donax TaxID=35708 RepID=A0A0A9DLU9_ARUDO
MVLFDGHRVLVLLHSNGVLHDSHQVLLCCDGVLTRSRGSNDVAGAGGGGAVAARGRRRHRSREGGQ